MTKSANTSAAKWRPADFDAYEESLRVAVDLAAELAAKAAVHAEKIRAARAGNGPLVEVHDPFSTWLTLSGRQGCGKTMLAKATYAELRRMDPFAAGPWTADGLEYREENRRPGCRWLHVNEFIDRTLSGFYEYPEWLGREWVVAIDDLGANRELKTTAIPDLIYRLMNARLGKITIFTTNLSQIEIAERFDPRAQSRLIRDGNVFHRITAGDYALRRKGT